MIPYDNDFPQTAPENFASPASSIYPDKDTPTASNDFRKVDIVVTVEGLLPVGGGGTVSLTEIDPPNASGTGAANNGGALVFTTQTLTFTNGNMEKTSVVTVGLNAGDNYIVKATPDNNTPSMQSEILTVWRRLWMELDQMAAPSMTVDDGFDPAKQYGGTIPNPPPPGFWGTALPSPEPQDFDLFFQPEIPDISLLTSAMVAACVTVKEAPSEWNTRTTTPFVHNLSNDLNSSAIAISNPSRDVNVNDAAFWCVHAIGAYEYTIGADGDGETSYTYGTATTDGSTIITIYNETIRDGAVYFSAINHNQAMMTKINVFHETLHRFGLDHPDGGVMATGNSNNLPNGNPEPHSSTTANTRSTYLLTEHIQKVQVRDYPR